MNRRGFLAAVLATAALDPERLLWQPCRKLISIPAPRVGLPGLAEKFAVGDIISFGDSPYCYVVTTVAESTLSFSMLTNEALLVLTNSLVFARNANRKYDNYLSGAKIGNQVSVRKPPRSPQMPTRELGLAGGLVFSSAWQPGALGG